MPHPGGRRRVGQLGAHHAMDAAAFAEGHMPNDTTRWTVSVSKDTDITVRSFLAQRGMRKGDLSKFIEEAVRWRVFDQTLADARTHFADMPPDELEALIDEAVDATRKAKSSATR